MPLRDFKLRDPRCLRMANNQGKASLFVRPGSNQRCRARNFFCILGWQARVVPPRNIGGGSSNQSKLEEGDDPMATQMWKTGLNVVGDMVAWGAHICRVYETKEDLLDTLRMKEVTVGKE